MGSVCRYQIPPDCGVLWKNSTNCRRSNWTSLFKAKNRCGIYSSLMSSCRHSLSVTHKPVELTALILFTVSDNRSNTQNKNINEFFAILYTSLWSHYLQCILKFWGKVLTAQRVDMEARHLRGGTSASKWFKIIKQNMHIVYTCIYIHIVIYSICECKFLLTLQTVTIFVVSFEFEMCVRKTFISLSSWHPSSYYWIDLERVLYTDNHKFISIYAKWRVVAHWLEDTSHSVCVCVIKYNI